MERADGGVIEPCPGEAGLGLPLVSPMRAAAPLALLLVVFAAALAATAAAATGAAGPATDAAPTAPALPEEPPAPAAPEAPAAAEAGVVVADGLADGRAADAGPPGGDEDALPEPPEPLLEPAGEDGAGTGAPGRVLGVVVTFAPA